MQALRSSLVLALLTAACSPERSAEITSDGGALPEPAPDEVIVPVEVADVDALGRLQDWRALPQLVAEGHYLQKSSSDRGNPDPAEEELVPIIVRGGPTSAVAGRPENPYFQ